MARQASTMQRKLIRTSVLFAFSTLMLLGFVPQASAAKVGYSSYFRTIYYVAGPGEANNVTITTTANSFVISDPNVTLVPDKGCTLINGHGAICSGNVVSWLYVKTGDLDDTVSLQPLTTAMIDCGLGNDTLQTPSPNAKPTGCEYVNPPPPATPVTPPTVAPVPPPLSIVQPVSTMTPRGSVPLTLSCSTTAAGPCTGTLVFILPKAQKSQVGASRRGAPNIVGREKISVRKGKKRKVKVSMTGKGRSMVKRRKRLKVTAKLQIKQGGQTTTTTQTLTIKAPRGR